MHQVDPLYDCNKRYGHSPVNTPCVELGPHLNSLNIAVNLLGGLDGVSYANTLNEASNTLEFLNFFDEASKASLPNGNAFFLIVSMTCFYLTVTYVLVTLKVRIPPVCPIEDKCKKSSSLRFQGPKIFNSLSSEIQNASSIALFNSNLKSFFSV